VKGTLKGLSGEIGRIQRVMPLISESIHKTDLKNELVLDSAYKEIDAERDFSAFTHTCDRLFLPARG
jgi:hypothetical protein